ncbi:recombinase family protein [Intestinibacillus massiliensis]|nr:recombinase family protein [Intestinibacillus massiliensis]
MQPTPTPDGIRIGAAYIRVSTDDQVEYSPESQLVEIRKYAKTNNIVIPDEYVFVDEGISGKSTNKRDGFMRMIGVAKTKPRPFDVVLLWKFSRFARNREDSILYKSMLRRELGIEVVSVSEPIGDEGMSIIIEAMIEAMDEYYSINLAGEVRRGMTQRAKEGKPNTYAPMGYRMQDGEYVEDPDAAPVVRKIFEDFAGGKPLVTIARELNAIGIRTRFGNPLENRSVEYILRNPVYIGKVRWTPTGRTRRDWDNPDTITVDGPHAPLIPRGLYDEVQHLLDEQKRKYAPHGRRDGHMFALKGLLRCSSCGSTLVLSSKTRTAKGGPSVQCHRYARGQCPESHSIQLAAITEAVFDRIEQDFQSLNFGVMAADGQRMKSSNAAQLLGRQIAREEQKLERIREAYEAGVDTLEEYRARKAAIEGRIAALRESAPAPGEAVTPAAFAAAHQDALQKLRDEGVTDADKNDALRRFIRCVIFDRKNNCFQIQYYA